MRGVEAKSGEPTNVVAIGEPMIMDADAAVIIGLALQTVRNDRINRRLGIPFYRFGKSIRYKPSELAAWVAKHAVVSDGKAA